MRPVGVGSPRKRAPSQAEVVGVFMGTFTLLQNEISYLPQSVLAEIAARLVPLIDFDQPTLTFDLDEPNGDMVDVQSGR